MFLVKAKLAVGLILATLLGGAGLLAAVQAASRGDDAKAGRGGGAQAAADKPEPASLKTLQRLLMVGQGIAQYAVAHDNRLPPDLGSALKYVKENDPDLANAAEVFLSAADSKTKKVPEDADAAWVNKNSSFTYIGAGVNVTKVPSETVIACEKKGSAAGGKVHVLCADGHVEELEKPKADQRRTEAEKVIKQSRSSEKQ